MFIKDELSKPNHQTLENTYLQQVTLKLSELKTLNESKRKIGARSHSTTMEVKNNNLLSRFKKFDYMPKMTPHVPDRVTPKTGKNSE